MESKFADLVLDQVEAVLEQDPCMDSLHDLLKIASPLMKKSSLDTTHEEHFKKLKFQVHPDRHAHSLDRANKLFQSMTEFYKKSLALSKTGQTDTRKRKFNACIPKEKSVGSLVAYQCINARGIIAHGKKTNYHYFSKNDKDKRSAKEMFEQNGGYKLLSTLDEIKEELMTRGPVVSSSFKLSEAFLNSVEGRVKFFDSSLKNKVHDVLITGWKHTPMGEAWRVFPLVQIYGSKEDSFDIGFGQYNIDSLCIAPKSKFEDWSWEHGPYFKCDLGIDREKWYSWSTMEFSITPQQLEELSEAVGGNLIKGATSRVKFTVQDSKKKAHSRSCFLTDVTYKKEDKSKCWRVSVEFVKF